MSKTVSWPNKYSACVRAWGCARLFSRWPLLAWGYEIGFANFCQRLFTQQKPQDSTDAGAVRGVAAVLGADERGAVAQVGSAGFVDAGADGVAASGRRARGRAAVERPNFKVRQANSAI